MPTTRPTPDNTLGGLVALCGRLGLSEEDLCDLVLDAKCEEGSRINAGAVDDQVAYLLECWDAAELRQLLEDIALDEADARTDGD